MLEGDDPLTAITGVSLRGKNSQERRDFIVNEFAELHPFKDTKYPLKRVPSIREWLQGKEGNIEEFRSYNWDYDLKRKPIAVESDKGRIRFQTTPFQTIGELSVWKDCYSDFKRGVRQGNTQIGTKNKLCTPELMRGFLDYVKMRQAQIDTIKRLNPETQLRIFANLLARLKRWGYKRIGTELCIDHSKVKFWIKKTPLTDEELRGGVICDILTTIGSLITPPELAQEVHELWREWSVDKTEGGQSIPVDNIALELLSFVGSIDESRCGRKYYPLFDMFTSSEVTI